MRVSTICRILGGAALAVACSVPAVAQPKPVYYRSVCLKVKPGRDMDFASQLNGNVLKLEQSQLKAGVIRRFEAMRNVIPSGKAATCDYIINTFYPGLPPAGMNGKELADALHRAGLDVTPAEFWTPIMKDTRLVFTYVGEIPVLIGSRSKKGDYIEVNEMHLKNPGACLKTEETLWQPVAEARIKAGQQSGWGLWQIVLPRGTQVKPNEGTVDILSSWDQIFMEGLAKTWQEVHPNMAMADATAQFSKDCEITHSPIYKVVEVVQAPMQ